MNRRNLLIATCALVLGLTLTSCQRGRPARKELPEYLGTLPEIPATVTPFPSHAATGLTGNYLMYSTDTTLFVQGDRRELLLLAFPDPAQDSTLQAMIGAGRSLVPYLLKELRGQHKAGLVIDLRIDPASPTTREDYLVSGDALGDFPVIFLWDRNSAGRAAAYTQCLTQFPGISWSVSDGRPRYQTDCFKASHPSL
ncbi:MAG TPA: hypothetical protein VN616_06250 [Puia sp.]|nr:hypothetical protein [Puia sp.]